MRINRFLIPATVAVVAAFHLATLRAGHDWGDDFGLYVAHARNLAEGRPYADTGYVYNPYFPSLSPRTYPPVFPLLLAPVYAGFGLNLGAMKVLVVLLFAGFLAVLGVTLRRRIAPPLAAACLLAVGLNPFVWGHKDRLLSEIPFLLFAYLSLYCLDRAGDEPDRWKTRGWAALGGLAAYLAFGTRTVGIVLIPSVVLLELLRTRRVGATTLVSGAVFAAGVGVQAMLLRVDGSYADQLVSDPRVFARVGVSLVRAMGHFFENGYSAAANHALYLVLLVPAALGFVLRLRERPTVYEPFAVLSFGLLVLWPFAEWQRRYLLPLLPLFVFYAAEGLVWLGRRVPARVAAPAGAAVGLAVLLSYAGWYTRLDFGPFREGVSDPETQALFRFVREHTRPDDVILFHKPRALALFTGRHASGHHVPPSDEHLLAYLRRINADYVIATPQLPDSWEVLGPFVRRQADRLEPVYHTEQFTLYRVRPDAVARK